MGWREGKGMEPVKSSSAKVCRGFRELCGSRLCSIGRGPMGHDPSILGVNKGLFYCSKCEVFLESDKEANKHKSKCNTELDPVSPLVSPSDFKDLVAVDFCLQELSTLVDDDRRQ